MESQRTDYQKNDGYQLRIIQESLISLEHTWNGEDMEFFKHHIKRIQDATYNIEYNLGYRCEHCHNMACECIEVVKA